MAGRFWALGAIALGLLTACEITHPAPERPTTAAPEPPRADASKTGPVEAKSPKKARGKKKAKKSQKDAASTKEKRAKKSPREQPLSEPGAEKETKDEAPPAEEAKAKKDPRDSRSFPPLGAGSKAATECSADSDCVLSCHWDGRCCPELCGCSQVYNKTFAAGLAAAVANQCSADVMCPVARCAGTKGGEAVCQKGACRLKRASK